MKFICLIGFLFGVACATAADSPFDTARVQPGRFVYRDTKNGKQIGTFTLNIIRQPDDTCLFTGDAEGFHQHWTSIAYADFKPRSATLSIIRDHGQPYSMKVRYLNGMAVGTVTRALEAAKATERPLPATTVDQRIDWAAMASARLAVGEEVYFNVYDPDTGATSVAGRAVSRQTTTVPAGTYDTLRLHYRMNKLDGAEAYDVLVTQGPLRVLVREEFPDGTITELIESHFGELKATPIY